MRLSRLLVESPDEPQAGDRLSMYTSAIGRKGSFAGDYEIVKVARTPYDEPANAYLVGSNWMNASKVIFVVCRHTNNGGLYHAGGSLIGKYMLGAFEVKEGIGNREIVDTSAIYRMYLFDTRRIVASDEAEVMRALEYAVGSGICQAYSRFGVEWA